MSYGQEGDIKGMYILATHNVIMHTLLATNNKFAQVALVPISSKKACFR